VSHATELFCIHGHHPQADKHFWSCPSRASVHLAQKGNSLSVANAGKSRTKWKSFNGQSTI
jgi:hypothetical protein